MEDASPGASDVNHTPFLSSALPVRLGPEAPRRTTTGHRHARHPAAGQARALRPSLQRAFHRHCAAGRPARAHHLRRRRAKKYILEAIGCGCAFFDYDNDGWMDIFLLSGTRLEGDPPGATQPSLQEQSRRHVHRRHRKGRPARAGWASGVSVGDYNNDGFEDIFITYCGQNVLYRNNGDGTFTDVTEKAGLLHHGRRAGAPAAPSSTTIATAIWICSSPTTSRFDSRHAPEPGARVRTATGKASRSIAARAGCPRATSRSITTTATARSPTSARNRASPQRSGATA